MIVERTTGMLLFRANYSRPSPAATTAFFVRNSGAIPLAPAYSAVRHLPHTFATRVLSRSGQNGGS